MTGAASTPHTEPSEIGAMERVDAAEFETFEAFYRRELPGLVALARALSGSAGLADDLAQESMIVAYRRWDEVSELGQPAAWVRKVCANKSSSLLRRRATETRALLRLGARRDEPSTGELEHEDFWRTVRALPRRQAQVVALHYALDMGVTAIAECLRCSESSVKAHLVRGRRTVARRLGADLEEQR